MKPRAILLATALACGCAGYQPTDPDGATVTGGVPARSGDVGCACAPDAVPGPAPAFAFLLLGAGAAFFARRRAQRVMTPWCATACPT